MLTRNARSHILLFAAIALSACGSNSSAEMSDAGSSHGGSGGTAGTTGGDSGEGGSASTPDDASAAGTGGNTGSTDGGASPADGNAPSPDGLPAGVIFIPPVMPPAPPTDAPVTCDRTVHVTDNASFAAAVAGGKPGDCIELADGNYAALDVTAKGTEQKPIVIRAVTRDKALITSGLFQLTNASYVTIDGLAFTGAGGTAPVDGKPHSMGFQVMASDHCRITRCLFRMTATPTYTEWLMLSGNSDSNRIDHCEFGPNLVHGCHFIWPAGLRDIPGSPAPADRTAWATGHSPLNPNMARNTRIDHNYLHDQAPATAEAIILGALGSTGDYQDTGSVVESNLFVNCDGDPEIISVKSSSNVIRYNTVRTSAGMFSLRAGNKNVVTGNFMFQAAKAGAGGIKIYEDDHTVYDNYIDSPSEYPILVGAGDKYDGTAFAHAQVHRARIVHNTIINAANRPIIMGHGSTDHLPPTDCIFASNLINGTAKTLLDEAVAPVSSLYAGNIVFPGGITKPADEFKIADPKLTKTGELSRLGQGSPAVDAAPLTFDFVTDDMDGQPRDKPDVGADELSTAPASRRPLLPADVGPAAP